MFSRVKEIHSAFVKAGLKCELSNRIQEILWEKFLFICPIGGICSVARASIGDVLDFKEIREFYVAALKETEAVARAVGINLADDIVARILAQAGRANKSTKPSMLRDLEHGKRLELDALNGAVVRLGRQFSVPTPVNDFIYAALKIHDLPTGSNLTPGTG
jgi:2-dehydropantoate 2-reductase